jgi:ATP-binding cassette, subfamily B, bacterial
VGSFLGQVFESENVEALAINGAISGLLAIMELAVAAAVLGRYSLLLLFWCVAAALLGWWFLRSSRKWTSGRMQLTQSLIESMVGHRTRLVQESAVDRHDEEDRALDGYMRASRTADRLAVLLAAGVPRGWLVTAVACAAPAVVAVGAPVAGLAALVGGILLAYSALRRLTASFAGIAGAMISWERIAPLFHAAARPALLGDLLPSASGADAASVPILEAHHLNYSYAPGKAAVHDATFTIRTGDRVLVEGPSGGGKSTLASLIAGLREPQSGLLLCAGLDRHTLGEERWRQRIASAPQFHDNHVLAETFAFNLLMGRCWPPKPGDLEEAEALCRRLGLGDLLDRMPAGLMEMVGDCGWRLSHGEKSRLFMARALLQKAPLVVLDESFAALDPQSTSQSLQCAFECAETLMVIAHP